MRQKISCIYAIVSPSNKAYIGSTKDYADRTRQHKRMMKGGCHHSDAVNNAVKKYGKENMHFAIVERCSIDNLIEREQWWIDNHKIKFAGIYNASGVAGRIEHTAEVRAKISKSSMGRVPSAEARAKMSLAARTIYRHPAWCKAVADAQRGKIIPDDVKAKMSASAKVRKRHPMSEETKERIRQAKLGKPVSAEKRANMSAAQLRRYARDGGGTKSLATREKMSQAAYARYERERKEAE